MSIERPGGSDESQVAGEPARVLVLSGPIAVGKTTTAELLTANFGWASFFTRDVLMDLANGAVDRDALGMLADKLGQETKGRWLVHAVEETIRVGAGVEFLVIDTIRRRVELDALRGRFGRRLTHLHLLATLEVLEGRYRARYALGRPMDKEPYSKAARRHSESEVMTLSKLADITIDTSTNSPVEVATLADRIGRVQRG